MYLETGEKSALAGGLFRVPLREQRVCFAWARLQHLVMGVKARETS